MTLSLITHREMMMQIAANVKAKRLEKVWSQKEISKRAGIQFSTYRAFERTGHISLERLLKIATALGVLDDFGNLFKAQEFKTIADVIKTHEPKRMRGKST